MSGEAEVLEEAAKIVERGWRQGMPIRDEMGRVVECCAAVAVSEAAAGVGAYYDSHVRAIDLLTSFVRGAGFGRIAEWNDAPGRTASEVAATLRGLAGKEAE